MDSEKSFIKSLVLIAGFIAIIAAIAGAVYGVIKYIEDKKNQEFMDYYFDDDEDYEDYEDYLEQGEEEAEPLEA